MIVYRRTSGESLSHHLEQKAPHLAKYLFPSAKILDMESDPRRVLIKLRNGDVLIGMELFGNRLDSDAFESFLRSVADLEAKRKALQDPSLSEIALCVLASGFAEDLPPRVSQSLPRVDCFEWGVIQSDQGEALLIQPLHPSLPEESPFPLEEGQPCETSLTNPQPLSGHQLSHRELIALARFGIELRDRRAQLGHLWKTQAA